MQSSDPSGIGAARSTLSTTEGNSSQPVATLAFQIAHGHCFRMKTINILRIFLREWKCTNSSCTINDYFNVQNRSRISVWSSDLGTAKKNQRLAQCQDGIECVECFPSRSHILKSSQVISSHPTSTFFTNYFKLSLQSLSLPPRIQNSGYGCTM